MNTDFKPVMDALFAHLSGAVVVSFTADTTDGQEVLVNASTVTNLFPGLPVFGPGVETGTVISAIDDEAGSILLSSPVEDTTAAASFSTGFLTADRRLQHWSQVQNQPAFFLRRIGVTDEAVGEGLMATTLECEAWIYCNAGQDPNIAPDDALTSLEKLVRESLDVPAWDDGLFDLGGLAHWCRIEGRSDISSGDQGPQAIARIPIRVTLP